MMGKFKGTKGKWVLDNQIAPRKISLNNRSIDLWFGFDFQGFPSEKEQKANALLISKAPEMLEMLEKVSRFIDENDDINYKIRELNREIPEIKQLIKEATEL